VAGAWLARKFPAFTACSRYYLLTPPHTTYLSTCHRHLSSGDHLHHCLCLSSHHLPSSLPHCTRLRSYHGINACACVLYLSHAAMPASLHAI